MGISIFKKDRILLALHMLKGVAPELIPHKEFEFFIGNSLLIESAS